MKMDKFIKENDEANNKEIESQVIGQLDRSAKLDEVDTVTFGLETDDGKIVKVYVNAEQADDFEKALSTKLGEVDDIEETLNELSKEFEIVDVEWPGDEKEEDEEGEEEDELETDGSEVMNKKVYNNKNENARDVVKAKITQEGKTRFRDQLLEDHQTIEDRMATPTQLLMFHAVLELGIPEIALNKSPYKASIISSIRHRATEINKNPSLKSVLKAFVQRVHDLDDDKKGEEEEEVKDKEPEVNDAEPKEKEDVKVDDGEEDDKKKPMKESIEQMIIESVSEDFWNGITKIIRYLSTETKHAEALLKTPKFKSLMGRSVQIIPKVLTTDMRHKLNRLSDSLDSNSAVLSAMNPVKVDEALKPEMATSFFNNLFTMIDPSATKSVSKTLLNSPEFKAYMTAIKPTLSQKFNGPLARKFTDVLRVLKAPVAADVPPVTTTTPKPNAKAPMMESAPKVLKEAQEWTFEMDGENAVISTEGLKLSLDSEQLEKAVKSVNAKNVVVVMDAEDPKKKFTLSPRGLTLVVKKVGENISYQMNADQIQEFMDLVAVEPEAPEETEDKESKEK